MIPDALSAASHEARPTLKSLVAAYERELIESALRASDGNQRRAAAALGLLPTTLHEKMKRLGLLRRVSWDGWQGGDLAEAR